MSEDFFFEDEKELEVKDSKSSKDGKTTKNQKGAKNAKPAAAKKAPQVANEAFQFTTIVVVLIAVIALLVGFLLGILLGGSLGVTAPATSAPTNMGGGGMGNMGSAPELSDEQMQQGMPEGHPNVGGGEENDEAPADGQNEADPGAEGTGGE